MRLRMADEPNRDPAEMPDDPVPADGGVDEQAEQAAREAGRIGGPGSNEDLDEAERPLAESGEGYAEGFEEAERELIDHAEHGDESPDPTTMAGEPEAERSDAEYGEADHAESSERAEDSDSKRR